MFCLEVCVINLIHDYIISLTNLYGLVHKDKVLEIYNSQNKNLADIEEINDIVRLDSNKLRDSFVFINGNYFVQEAIMYFGEFEKKLAERKGKPFYIPPKKELLNYKDEFYFEKTKHYFALLHYVTKHFTKGNKQRATDICEDIQLMCQDEFALSDILNRFNQLGIVFDSENQVTEVMNLVVNLANNTRMWANNGFTPIELATYEKRFETYGSFHT